MSRPLFNLWMAIIAVISFFTGEIVTFMMLFLILLTLNEINHTFQMFYDDWKRKNES